jgi:hypothetical protein
VVVWLGHSFADLEPGGESDPQHRVCTLQPISDSPAGVWLEESVETLRLSSVIRKLISSAAFANETYEGTSISLEEIIPR